MKRFHFLLCSIFFAVSAIGYGESAAKRSFTVDVKGSGKPVILIPGLACSAEVWNETVAHLNAKGYQTHALTLAGFGGTASIKTDRIPETVREDLANYIKEQKLEKPVIIGHSLGGFLALWISAEHPELPGKVISVDGLPFLASVWMPGVTAEGAKKLGAEVRQRMLSGSRASYEAQAKQTVASMVTSPVNVERETKVDLSSDQASVAEAMSEMMATDIRADMSKIRVPVLLLASWIGYKDYGATHDGVLATDRAQLSGAPHATVAVSDTAKHFIQLDAPEWFYSQVDEFLKQD